MLKNQTVIETRFPVVFWGVFWSAVVVATLYYSPSWGLMDDWGLLKVARDFWGPPFNFAAMSENYIVNGMLRPFYYSWAAIFYGIFRDWPSGFYVFIALGNLLAMILWGLVFNRVFAVRHEDRAWTTFFYPLTFFLYTPYWNIFNYLSLQEKFIVFFAPSSILLFLKLYDKFNWRYLAGLIVCLICGLMSKATFIYVLAILFLYPLLDFLLFRLRPQRSLIFMISNGLVLLGYVLFTLLFQIQGRYTEKYKSGLALGAFLAKVTTLPLVMKCLMLIGIVGILGVIGLVLLRRKKEYAPAIMIYAGLMAYIILLVPWGFHSYLISAIGPLAMGAVFPVFAWLISRGTKLRWATIVITAGLITMVYVGNILPNIERMADIGQAIAFIKQQSPSAEDIYFMPPGYEESAYATRQFTQKNVYYCSDGQLTDDLLTKTGTNYLILTNFFASMPLVGVQVEDLVFSNSTWRIYRLRPGVPGQEVVYRADFPQSLVHQLKVIIREL